MTDVRFRVFFFLKFCNILESFKLQFLKKEANYDVGRDIQGCFLTGPPQKMIKCQITCKSLQKSSKCQNFLRADQSTTLYIIQTKI